MFPYNVAKNTDFFNKSSPRYPPALVFLYDHESYSQSLTDSLFPAAAVLYSLSLINIMYPFLFSKIISGKSPV